MSHMYEAIDGRGEQYGRHETIDSVIYSSLIRSSLLYFHVTQFASRSCISGNKSPKTSPLTKSTLPINQPTKSNTIQDVGRLFNATFLDLGRGV